MVPFNPSICWFKWSLIHLMVSLLVNWLRMATFCFLYMVIFKINCDSKNFKCESICVDKKWTEANPSNQLCVFFDWLSLFKPRSDVVKFPFFYSFRKLCYFLRKVNRFSIWSKPLHQNRVPKILTFLHKACCAHKLYKFSVEAGKCNHNILMNQRILISFHCFLFVNWLSKIYSPAGEISII